MPFALILTVFGFNSPDMFYAIETGMTAESCVVKLQEQQILLEKSFAIADFELTCESYDAGD
jgi:hypothetical protein